MEPRVPVWGGGCPSQGHDALPGSLGTFFVFSPSPRIARCAPGGKGHFVVQT